MEVKTYIPSDSILSFTGAGYKYIKEQVQKQNAIGVRLTLKPGGCSGFEYKWDYVFEYYHEEGLLVQQEDDFAFLTDDLSVDMLRGSTVDLMDSGLSGQSLVVKSPNATGQCGCGESVAF